MTSSRARGWFWPLSAVLAATIPVAGVFTLSRIFYVRDLTLAFRSRFLFLRHAVAAHALPFWDPYVANGQSAASDALYQLFHFPSLPIRLLLPDVVAYNLWIALPIPLAAVGAYLYLRRYVRASVSAFGAVAFAVAGPTVSTTNFPNLSWSVICVPYVFYALDRFAETRRGSAAALLAVVLSAQALAGEPVTLAATLVIAAFYVTFPLQGWRDWRLLVGAGAALLLGIVLASIQFVPLAAAAHESVRSWMITEDFWSLHPLAFFELLVPHFFGNYFTSSLAELVWMPPLNSTREPFYYTMYFGVSVLLAAGVAAGARRPRTSFWAAVVVGCIVASLGAHTPIYPFLQRVVPGLAAFRFPVKYLSLMAMGTSVLSAMTVEWMLCDDVPRVSRRIVLALAAAFAVSLYGFIAWSLVAPSTPLRLVFELARQEQVRWPVQGAEFLLYRGRPLLIALVLKVLCGAFLLGVASSARRERRLAAVVFGVMAAVDLVAANSSVNPTMPLERLDRPDWVRSLPPDSHDRVYIGGTVGGYVESTDEDAPKYVTLAEGSTPMEQRMMVTSELTFHPSGWGLRQTLSYDLPLMWPVLNKKTERRFLTAPREDRLRFLSRVGTRYVVLPGPAPGGRRPLAVFHGAPQLKLYDMFPDATRIYIVPDALMGQSADWAVEGLFQPRFDPSAGILVSTPPPPPAGLPGAASKPFADFIEDGLDRVVVRAGLPADGYLALLDSYDPAWHVDVDGAPAPLMRANGLFRAVHLRRGTHVVTFTYHPRALYAGASLTGAAAAVLMAWWAIDARRRRRTPA